jgi:hypothetical protein
VLVKSKGTAGMSDDDVPQDNVAINLRSIRGGRSTASKAFAL